ncbi:MAG TPA: DsrH/TusB family sulfur metabolism protein [Dissulfurispiraceae bacterium]|nr:DsrH/TusB family sulfur metabolism protein [Dissulfurispiraceae bacterium]
MIVIVKSAPDTPDGQRGLKLARDTAADLILLQDSVFFVQGQRLEDFRGKIYVVDEDLKLRGLNDSRIRNDFEIINYDIAVDLMTESNKVVGMF